MGCWLAMQGNHGVPRWLPPLQLGISVGMSSYETQVAEGDSKDDETQP